MILAAGRGERMRPLTDYTPKPLLEVAGRPLIEHHLLRLRDGGFTDVVVNLAHLGHQIRDRLAGGEAYGLRIHYSDEGDTALETGGGIFNALRILGTDPFLVVNADIWCDRPLTPHRLRGGDCAHLVLVDNPVHHPRGDFCLQGTRAANSGDSALTFSGIGYYRPELFEGCEAGMFPLAPLLRRCAAEGHLSGEHHRGEWYDVGTPQRLQQLNARLANAR